MAYWLMKSEPDEVSIDDLARAPGQALPWTGVRNYQARNFMMKDMRVGVDVRLVRKTRLLSLAEMRAKPALATMRVLQRGNRLSITPVSAGEWRAVLRLLDATANES